MNLLKTPNNLVGLNQKKISLNNRKLTYKVEYFDKSLTTIKQTIDNDSLWVILNLLTSTLSI